MVRFLIRGLAQKLRLRMYARVINRINIPAFNPTQSFICPIAKETMAPPAMAVHKIPEKVP